MSSPSRTKRRKTSAQSPQKSRQEDGSDDDVVWLGTSPSKSQQQRKLKSKEKEVIELDISSDSSRFSRPNIKASCLMGKEHSAKRKRERSYDEVEEVARRKDPPKRAANKAECSSNVIDESLKQAKWTLNGVDDLGNNLHHVSPKMNMSLEIRDNDFIWSAAKIHKISNANSKNCSVTIRYEGWGSEWDEEMTYPNPRLARIFTYTKRVKCLAAVLSKKKELRGVSAKSSNIRNCTDIWPCTVSFRMPHPGPRDDKQLSPEDLLRLESNIFVQPYAPHLLSSFLQKGLTCGGWWVATSLLRLWKEFDTENPISKNSSGVVLREVSSNEGSVSQPEYHLTRGFDEAYKIAKSDKWLRGALPPKATSDGTLLDDKYRVQNVGGDAIDGVKYTGAFDIRNAAKKRSSEASSRSSSPIPPPKVENVKPLPSIPESKDLPQPILVHYEHPGVRRLENSNRWASVVKIAGNDIFLGSFVSQTEALRARELALARFSEGDEKKKESASLTHEQAAVDPIDDLLVTPIEAVIQAFEESNATAPSFSLQNLLAEKISLPAYESQASSGSNTYHSKNKRKQMNPKRHVKST